MNLRDNLMFKFFGDKYLEFYFIDTALIAFADGQPRTDLPVVTGDLAWIDSRVNKYLTDNKFLEVFGNGYAITATGKMFFAKGGCRGEFLRHKLNRLSFILSLFASIISLAAMAVALCK